MKRIGKFLLLMALLLAMAFPGRCDDARSYYNSGYKKAQKGDFKGAIADFTKAIEIDPKAVGPFYDRANAKAELGDLDGAITDYDRCMELSPSSASPYVNRGLARKNKGDIAGAIADYTKAIQLKPDHPNAYIDRGNVENATADLNGAIADFTKAIELKPTIPQGYAGRGYARYAMHDFSDALSDFREAVAREPSGNKIDYIHFQIWLARARQGEGTAATEELRNYLDRQTAGRPGDWASKIGHFLAGQLTEPDFLAAAKNADPKTEAGQLCEAYFYAGSKRLIAGDKAPAMDYFQKSTATNEKDHQEYAGATAELKYLKAGSSPTAP